MAAAGVLLAAADAKRGERLGQHVDVVAHAHAYPLVQVGHLRQPAPAGVDAAARWSPLVYSAVVVALVAGLAATTVRLAGHRCTVAEVAAYNSVCGFVLADELPATWLHVLTFPLQLTLMTAADFPLAPLGMVHVSNVMTQHRPALITEAFDLVVRIVVDETGAVARAELVDGSSGEAAFAEAVLSAVRGWAFIPLKRITGARVERLPFTQDYRFTFRQVNGRAVVEFGGRG